MNRKIKTWIGSWSQYDRVISIMDIILMRTVFMNYCRLQYESAFLIPWTLSANRKEKKYVGEKYHYQI